MIPATKPITTAIQLPRSSDDCPFAASVDWSLGCRCELSGVVETPGPTSISDLGSLKWGVRFFGCSVVRSDEMEGWRYFVLHWTKDLDGDVGEFLACLHRSNVARQACCHMSFKEGSCSPGSDDGTLERNDSLFDWGVVSAELSSIEVGKGGERSEGAWVRSALEVLVDDELRLVKGVRN